MSTDAEECCDVDYACSFPPCVAERMAEGERWGVCFQRFPPTATLDQRGAYEPTDPKHPDFLERITA